MISCKRSCALASALVVTAIAALPAAGDVEIPNAFEANTPARAEDVNVTARRTCRRCELLSISSARRFVSPLVTSSSVD